MSIKIDKETNLQKELIEACILMGGFGDKIQDKYIKGKSDVWLKLPSGLIIFSEIKVVRNAVYTISPEFKALQLEYMEQLSLNRIPVIGLIFVKNAAGYVDFKVSSFKELKALYDRHGKVKYHISHFKRARSFEMIINEIENFFMGSMPQVVKVKSEISETFFA
jgi:hypothetical protein